VAERDGERRHHRGRHAPQRGPRPRPDGDRRARVRGGCVRRREPRRR
jgi:hypothetical protein